MKRLHPYLYYLLLFITAFLAFLPVAQLLHPLKWDIIEQAYPWRYFIGECLKDGMLPLWNPYQLLGSPIHADPQGSAWYPLTWCFGFIFGYNVYILSIDFILHIFLAGMGMFYLAKRFGFRDETAFLMGISYMLSGFFTGNAQHFMWIISGTWIPFIIGAFLELRQVPSLTSAIKLGLAFFMIMTGGYPAFIFLLLYLLAAIYILNLVEDIRQKHYPKLLRYTGTLALSAAFTLMAGLVVIISVYHLQDAMTRGSGVTLQQALFGAFTPKSFISFLLPFAAIREMEIYNTDLSMSNAYVGLIALVFFLMGLMIKRSKLVNLFLVWGIFCLAAAVGSALPVREFLYNYMPLMNLFRFPALFRVFVILSFIIVAGFAFDQWRKEGKAISRQLTASIAILFLAALVFVIITLTKGNLDFGYFLKNQLFIFADSSRIIQHILFQAIIQLILLVLIFLLVTKWRTAKYGLAGLILLASLDLVLATRLNGPYTVYTDNFKTVDLYRHAKDFPSGFPVPGNTPIIENRDTRGKAYQALWRNLNIFHKEVSFEGYNPLHLKGFEEIADNHTGLFNTILENPLVYLSDKASPLDSLAFHEEREDFDRKRVYLDEREYVKLKVEGLRLNEGDTVIIRSFSPEKITVHSSTSGIGLINVLQNNYYGWKARVDGKPVEVFTGNIGFISLLLPAGEHDIDFIYDPTGVKTGFWISLLTVIAGLGFLFICRFTCSDG